MAERRRTRRGVEEEQRQATDEGLLATARTRFALAQEVESRQRERELRDLRFTAGQQWEDETERMRRADQRPCLVMNRIPQFVAQIANEAVVNPTGMRAHPVDDRADLETAKIIQGLFRNIEVQSQADVAYWTAYEAAVTHGVGYFRLITEYESPTSFTQVLRIKRIRNRFAVYLDPSHQELDGSDANWGFVVDRMSRSEFCERYRVRPQTLDAWTGTGDNWITRGEVQVAEYFYREWVEEELVQLADGEIRLRRETQPTDLIVQRRRTHLPVVWWTKINGYQVLERTLWLGSSVPIIPVYGVERDINGEVERTGIAFNLLDPQRIVNYMASAEAEAIGLAPRAPFVGAEGQFEGYEDLWGTANTRNHAFLVYKPVSSGGVPVPAPQRMAVEPAVQAIAQSRMFAVEDMKAVLGIYDASLGAQSNEIAAVAIEKRAQQGAMATARYPANLMIAKRRCAALCLELIPLLYDRATVQRIIGEDDEPKMVQLNQPFRDETGIEQLYDVRRGKYDVVPASGPSYQTRREEAATKIDTLVRAYPPVMAVAGDYLVRNLDMPYSQEIAARLRTQVPAEALAATESGRAEDQVAGLQNQVVELTQQLQALNSYAQQAEGQMAEAQQRIAELELRTQNKADELRLKGRELDLKQRELDLKQLEIELDYQTEQDELALKARAAQNGTEEDGD